MTEDLHKLLLEKISGKIKAKATWKIRVLEIEQTAEIVPLFKAVKKLEI